MTDETPIRRRLAAILAADIAGYSRLMGQDEVTTVLDLKSHQAEVLPRVGQHGGRIIDTAGDGILAEFPSVTDATACALEIQAIMASRNEHVSENRRMRFRMGINLGDVIFDGHRIYGDGINVAARLEGLAEPGGILVSHAVYEQVRDRLDVDFDEVGEQALKNIARPVRVYRLRPSSTSTVATERAASTTDKSIAVLAFVDMSPQKDQEYFSDGMAEELLNLLSQVTQLRVIARTSSFSFKGQKVSVEEIARRLNVTHVLEGSIRKAGNRVRVTAQLIRTTDSSHVWSATYDRALDDIFAVQDEIAAEVVEQLKVRLLGAAPKAVETDSAAYELYLQARELHRQGTAAGYEPALALLDQALTLDPRYVPAWTLKSGIHGDQAAAGAVPAPAGWRHARESVNRALVLDPEDGVAHARKGWIAIVADRDLAAAAQHFERALTLAPTHDTVLRGSATLLLCLGRVEQALAVHQWVVARDPMNTRLHVNLGLTYLWAGRFDAALASYRAVLGLSPGMIGAQAGVALALRSQGQLVEALAAAQQESVEVSRLLAVAMILHTMGHAAESDATLTEIIEKYARDFAYNIAYVLAYRGEADRAFQWLDKAVALNDGGLSEIVVQPEFASLHDDPRWLPFLRSIGMAPEQLAAIPFEAKLPT